MTVRVEKYAIDQQDTGPVETVAVPMDDLLRMSRQSSAYFDLLIQNTAVRPLESFAEHPRPAPEPAAPAIPREYRPRPHGTYASYVAPLAIAGVVIAGGIVVIDKVTGIFDDIGGFFNRLGHSFATQVDVKQEANAALSHITIRGDPIAVDGYGSAVSSTSIGLKCPNSFLAPINPWDLCDKLPKAHDGIAPYYDSKVKLVGDDQIIIDNEAWTFSADVDQNGNPITVVTLQTDQIHAQPANIETTKTSHDYLSEVAVDGLNLQTGTDEIDNATADTANSVYMQICGEVLYKALPAAVAKEVHTIESYSAQIVEAKFPDAAKWLRQLASSPVKEKFVGDETNLNGPKVVNDVKLNQKGLKVDRKITKTCELGGTSKQDLKGYVGQEGKVYTIDSKMPPLSKKPYKPVQVPGPATTAPRGHK